MRTSILKHFTRTQISTITINAYITISMTIRKVQVLSWQSIRKAQVLSRQSEKHNAYINTYYMIPHKHLLYDSAQTPTQLHLITHTAPPPPPPPPPPTHTHTRPHTSTPAHTHRIKKVAAAAGSPVSPMPCMSLVCIQCPVWREAIEVISA